MAEGGLKELEYFVSNTTLVILDLSTYFAIKLHIERRRQSF
jgi:hypothetical protein